MGGDLLKVLCCSFAVLWVGELVQRALHTSAVKSAGVLLHRSPTREPLTHASVRSSF